jgi:hypothetical protein
MLCRSSAARNVKTATALTQQQQQQPASSGGSCTLPPYTQQLPRVTTWPPHLEDPVPDQGRGRQLNGQGVAGQRGGGQGAGREPVGGRGRLGGHGDRRRAGIYGAGGGRGVRGGALGRGKGKEGAGRDRVGDAAQQQLERRGLLGLLGGVGVLAAGCR